MEETIRWIPVADRLPDDEIAVLVAFDDGEVLMGWHEDKRWRDISGFLVTGVTHWATVEGPR